MEMEGQHVPAAIFVLCVKAGGLLPEGEFCQNFYKNNRDRYIIALQ